jgi:hypothetical protein
MSSADTIERLRLTSIGIVQGAAFLRFLRRLAAARGISSGNGE